MPPRARKAPQETAADTTPVVPPETPPETPEDEQAPLETASPTGPDPLAPEDDDEDLDDEDLDDDDQEEEPAPEESPYVQALLRERAGYLRYDRADRAAEVDRELRRHGVTPPSS